MLLEHSSARVYIIVLKMPVDDADEKDPHVTASSATLRKCRMYPELVVDQPVLQIIV